MIGRLRLGVALATGPDLVLAGIARLPGAAEPCPDYSLAEVEADILGSHPPERVLRAALPDGRLELVVVSIPPGSTVERLLFRDGCYVEGQVLPILAVRGRL